MTLQEYRAENPELDHVPDEEVEKLLAYQGWRWNRAWGQLTCWRNPMYAGER